jgi:hypothetical protein
MTNSWKKNFTKKVWRVHQNKNPEKRKRQLIGWVMIPGTLVVPWLLQHFTTYLCAASSLTNNVVDYVTQHHQCTVHWKPIGS